MVTKAALLDTIAGTNRGLLATETQKQAILAAIASLEDFNPNPRPLEASYLLEGDWRLLYTTSKALLNLDRFPFCKLGQIYQSIRVATTSVYNIAEIYGLPSLEGLVSVAAEFEPVSERRVQVKFKRSIIGLQKLMDYNSPDIFIQQIESGQKFTALDFPIKSDQQGWLDITYIDNNLRIGRGNEGSVFVLSKV
ncbi:PAP/fibrillin family protein [Anabaena sp. UHCC 0451]|uniref:PAP/fibrillin family protein n=1 Tax=Anabaena sp. UHCC 0451 TaxID=2055235 RepID=UPI002B1E90F1|nr:PAP/fibrillin family protein [Anabaena sp. UHCC 0451]MEA5576929.1 PAP/fibrillin family protein [Anabaena sp. UHCC 0451]